MVHKTVPMRSGPEVELMPFGKPELLLQVPPEPTAMLTVLLVTVEEPLLTEIDTGILQPASPKGIAKLIWSSPA